MSPRVKARRFGAGAIAAFLSAATLAVGAPSANAADTAWYLDELGYTSLHEEGWTGDGVTIAIAETDFDPSMPDLEGANIEYVPLPAECEPVRAPRDESPIDDTSISHGSNVAAMIVGQGGEGRIQGVAPDARLLVYELPGSGFAPSTAGWPEECDGGSVLAAGRLAQAERDGADIFSLSAVFGGEPEAELLAYWAMIDGAYFVAAGNYSHISGVSAGAVGVGAVTATKPGGGATDWAAQGPELAFGAPGEGIHVRDRQGALKTTDGTSFSTPIAAGTLALGKQKWPDASNRQLMQAMAASASGGGSHGNDLGYGTIDPAAFLATDPSSQPDEPLVFEGGRWDDPQWGAVRAVCDGFTPDEVMGYAEQYEMDAGINPAAVSWLPQIAKDEGWLGMAPNADQWGEGDTGLADTGGNADDADGDRTNVVEPTPREDGGIDAVMLVLIIGGAVVVLGAIIAVVVVAANRKKAPPRGAVQPNPYGGHPPYPPNQPR